MLKPCIFCGGKSAFVSMEAYKTATMSKLYFVFCPDCGCNGPKTISELTAIENWSHPIEKMNEMV